MWELKRDQCVSALWSGIFVVFFMAHLRNEKP